MRTLVIISMVIATYFFSGVGLTNSGDSPQYRLTQALVDRRSVCLLKEDKYVYPDIGLVGGNCIVSGRGAGESIIAIPFYIFSKYTYKFVRLPYNGFNPGVDQNSGIEASTAMINALSGSLCVFLVFKISVLLFYNKKASAIASFLFMVGTLNWKYSSIFYRHTISLLFMLLSTYLLIKLIKYCSRRDMFSFVLFCLSVAINIFIEPTSLFFCLTVVFVYLVVTTLHNKDIVNIFVKSLLLAFIIVFVNFPIFAYNFYLFKNPFNYGWESQSVNTWLANKQQSFSTPFIPSLITNLFNPNIKISQNTFSQYLLDNEQIKIQQSYYYASRYNYKGVFAQSPFLLLVFISPLLLRNKKYYFLLMFLAIVATLLSFKYLVFYSPNSYDTRFFLPIYAFFTILTVPTISVFINTKNISKKLFFVFLLLMLTLISVFNGWVSTVENYAPHVTGEKRTIAVQLLQSHNLLSVIIETFPNVYNYRIFFIYIYYLLS